ncbi:MAG: hypothetical protein WB621_08995 [Candidatus Acidiferrales bacterium]
MKRFFELTFRPFFVITGAATTLGALLAFWPRWAAVHLLRIDFVQDYTIILQHWGFLLGLVGVFMIVAAFREDWRQPVLILCCCEKAFVVYLVIVNARYPYSHGLRMGAARDATVALYTIGYFAFGGSRTPLPTG